MRLFHAPLLLAANDREDDVVANTGRGGDLLDAATGLEESANLVPPLSLGPLAALSDALQCFEFVVRHCRRVIVGKDVDRDGRVVPQP